jgi:multiple sugar transport system ATP-binding protein
MAAVTFDNVVKTFGSAFAVRSLDLEIRDGEFVSLLGPSGCGKTTTLRMLAGLEFPTSGRISIGSRVVNEVPPGRRDIAMVFQSYALYPHMTVAENIAYPLKKKRIAKADRTGKVAEVAAILQLTQLLDRKPRQLSGGQQQRVALGRALVRDPQVFLLDEPLSNLDAKLRAHMRAELIELHRRLGRTFVYVTHDQLEAMTMSDRIAIMKDGALQQFGAPREIYAGPANLFVAGFIGTPAMNFLSGEMQESGRGTAWRHEALSLPVMLEQRPGSNRRAVVGIRPEDVVIGTGPLTGRVRLVEPTGHETIVVLEVPSGTLTTRVASDVALTVGEAVSYELRTYRLHLFDTHSEKRIDARIGPVQADAA